MSEESKYYDCIISNGSVIDGSGQPGIVQDVAILGERIVKIGDLKDEKAKIWIDATRQVVAPGFIDVHTHDDAGVIARPSMTEKLSQGVTTVICGNCGISGAPYSYVGDPPGLLRMVFKSDQFIADSLENYLKKVTAAGPAVNAAFLTGHTTLRMNVMGEDDLDRVATDDEIAAMRALLTQSLEQGSIGLSTGLFYPPARAASTREVIEVARPLKYYDGVYTTHMRDEADDVVQSIQEALEIGKAIEAPVIVSHHKCMGQQNFGRSVETLALFKAARKHQKVSLDVYPYTACSTVLNEIMVGQALKTLISWSDPHPEFCASDLDQVAQTLGCSRAEAIERLQPGGAIYFMMDEEDVARIMCSPGAMIGSDGLPEDKHPHPRLWGTFPRVLGRYVRDLKILSLEDAVHRMTGLSASQFGIKNRGLVQVGMYADLTIFNADTIIDMATFEHPTTPAAGISHVIVNGKTAWQNGTQTDYRGGKVLRRRDLAD
ncbi:MAG TPA: D-aminoacylase [Polaromonas sp.]|uniref:N-acyl-D-amino-acid deacylase family protein n=1 Tax=Polaromonas sp. UBA4122 TaxID=1947074 RepID=UPI000EBC3AC6|nr:D-aminoacylase [Polaromonas sp. UBA4122]HAL37804.1 D-aminoacylase [Polaromonas sp.]